jgi:hypothetical protein
VVVSDVKTGSFNSYKPINHSHFEPRRLFCKINEYGRSGRSGRWISDLETVFKTKILIASLILKLFYFYEQSEVLGILASVPSVSSILPTLKREGSSSVES